MNALPKTVKVGPHEYRVTVVPTADMVRDDQELLGECDYDTVTIRLVRGLRYSKKQEVLWHEVKHACALHAGLSGKQLDEEGWVDGISPVELQVLRENPDLVRFLTSDAPRKSRSVGPRKKAAKAVPDHPNPVRPDVEATIGGLQDMRSISETGPA